MPTDEFRSLPTFASTIEELLSLTKGRVARVAESREFEVRVLIGKETNPGEAAWYVSIYRSVPVNSYGVLLPLQNGQSIFIPAGVKDTHHNPAVGLQTIEIGHDATTTANYSVAIGYSATSAVNSVALGYDAEASSNETTALGSHTIASGSQSTAIGQGAKARAEGATAIGRDALVDGAHSIGIGRFAEATGLRSIAIGNNAVSSQNDRAVIRANQLYLQRSDGVTSVSTLALDDENGNPQALSLRANGRLYVAGVWHAPGNISTMFPANFKVGTTATPLKSYPDDAAGGVTMGAGENIFVYGTQRNGYRPCVSTNFGMGYVKTTMIVAL